MLRHERDQNNALDSVKAQILSNLDIQNDFAPCAILFKDNLAQTKEKNPELNISAANSHQEGTEHDYKKCKDEHRYYTMNEYHNLTLDQKIELKDLHDARVHNPKKAKKRFLKNQVAALAQQIATMETVTDRIKTGNTQGSSKLQDNHRDNTNTSQGISNRNHPALSRY